MSCVSDSLAIGAYYLGCGIGSLILPIGNEVISTMNRGSESLARVNLIHCTYKMTTYNPIFLTAAALTVIGRIALPRVAQQSLAETAAGYSYNGGRAVMASLAIFSLIVFCRALSPNADHGVYLIRDSGYSWWRSPWF